MRGESVEGTFDRMSDGHTTDPADTGPAEKNPAQWTTGDEPITGPQRSYLETLLQQAGQDAPADLDRMSKVEASRRIDELQESTGRGR